MKLLGTGGGSAYALYLGCSRHARPLPPRLCRPCCSPQSLHCYGVTGGGVLSLMGNSQGRDNVRKRKARRKKTERLALAKRKQNTRERESRGSTAKQLG